MPLVPPRELAPGDYITNGRRLLRIERVTQVGVDCEDCRRPVKIVSLASSDLEGNWQKVEYERDESEDDPAVPRSEAMV